MGLDSAFSIHIEARVFDELDATIFYYNSQKTNLGLHFYKEVKKTFGVLQKNPFFQIRYRNIRCIPLKKFPFLVHYFIDEETKKITILAVINTHQNPDSTYTAEER